MCRQVRLRSILNCTGTRTALGPCSWAHRSHSGHNYFGRYTEAVQICTSERHRLQSPWGIDSRTPAECCHTGRSHSLRNRLLRRIQRAHRNLTNPSRSHSCTSTGPVRTTSSSHNPHRYDIQGALGTTCRRPGIPPRRYRSWQRRLAHIGMSHGYRSWSHRRRHLAFPRTRNRRHRILAHKCTGSHAPLHSTRSWR